MTTFQILISHFASEPTTIGVLLFISLLLSEKKNMRDFYIIIFTTSLAMFITVTLKFLCKVPRPLTALVPADSYRFPSGHATIASVVMSLGIYYTYTHIKNEYVRNIICLSFIGWYFLVSYSRIYLQVHYPIDVIVGGIIGLFSTLFVLHIIKRVHKI